MDKMVWALVIAALSLTAIMAEDNTSAAPATKPTAEERAANHEARQKEKAEKQAHKAEKGK